MGCIRLSPDIIVAIEIESLRTWVDYDITHEDIIVTIGNCLSNQKTYSEYGIPNAFIGFEGQTWNKHDYKSYLNSLPEIFEPIGYLGIEYRVNMEVLGRNYLQLLTQGTYSDKVLKHFYLID